MDFNVEFETTNQNLPVEFDEVTVIHDGGGNSKRRENLTLKIVSFC